MFVAKCLAASLGFFFVVYSGASLAICIAWRIGSRFYRGKLSHRSTDRLFALRIFPWIFALLVTTALYVPSFWLLEPRVSRESAETGAPLLALSCLLLWAIGAWQVMKAQRLTDRAIENWLRGSSRVTLSFGSLTHRVGLLFTLGTVPLAIAAVSTVGFMLPSYALLYTPVAGEGACLTPLILGTFGLLIMSVGVARTLLAREALTLTGALDSPADSGDIVPVYQTNTATPALTVAGICTPKVLVSEAALAALSDSELLGALRHEIAHVEAHDNLKKLVLRFLVFPWMGPLERAWGEAAEMAADEAAVSSTAQALDLASALIKISRLTPVQTAALATGFLNGQSGLGARIERLFAWKVGDASQKQTAAWFVLPPAFVVMASAIAFYSPVLGYLHAFTEWILF